MSDRLSLFLRELAGRRWEWSRTDCCMPMADWIVDARSADPAADLRGTYSDARSCILMLRREGGLRPMLDRRFAAVGVRRTTEPRRGDVGTIKTWAAHGNRAVLRQIGAICLGSDRVAIFTPDAGLLILSDTPPLVAWRV